MSFRNLFLQLLIYLLKNFQKTNSYSSVEGPIDKKSKVKTIIIANLAKGIRNDLTLNTEKIKALIMKLVLLLDAPPNRFTRSFLIIKKRTKQKNLSLFKADKGETLIILTGDQYEQKMHAIVTNLKFNFHNHKTRKKIQSTKYVIAGNLESRERLHVTNPSSSKIYDYVKIHKSGHLIRLVVVFYTNPIFRLVK